MKPFILIDDENGQIINEFDSERKLKEFIEINDIDMDYFSWAIVQNF